jgi:ABC-type uncharacterized transport system auxiliary subunit
VKTVAIVLAVTACGGAPPVTHYYELAPPAVTTEPASGPALAIEAFDVDRPYDDDRMVYRVDPYRVDYYEYHRWAASPGALVGSYLADAFERSGRFRHVSRTTDDNSVRVVGRVLAIEEIDASPTRWLGRLAIELTAMDSTNGRVLWTRDYDEREPMPMRSPAGLARALTVAAARIAERAIPELVAQTSVAEPACATAAARR